MGFQDGAIVITRIEDYKITDYRHGETGDGKRPEHPWPPRLLSKKPGEDGAEKKSVGSDSSEQTEDHALPYTWFGIDAAEDGKGVWQEEGSTDALEPSTDVEKDDTRGISVAKMSVLGFRLTY